MDGITNSVAAAVAAAAAYYATNRWKIKCQNDAATDKKKICSEPLVAVDENSLVQNTDTINSVRRLAISQTCTNLINGKYLTRQALNSWIPMNPYKVSSLHLINSMQGETSASKITEQIQTHSHTHKISINTTWIQDDRWYCLLLSAWKQLMQC